jgi:hypothetical protein
MRLNFFPALILVTGSVYFFCCFLFSLIDGTFFICSVVNHSFSTVFVCPPGFTWYSYTISLFFDLAGGLLFTFFALFVFVTYLLAFYFFRKGKQQMEIESQIAGDSRSKKSLVLFSIVFYLSPFLITGFLFASLGISGKNESEKNSRSFNETQLDIHKATSEENIKYTEIAKNSKDLCPTSSEDIYITEPYKNDNGALHIPLGSINGIGAVFVSRENDNDGTFFLSPSGAWVLCKDLERVVDSLIESSKMKCKLISESADNNTTDTNKAPAKVLPKKTGTVIDGFVKSNSVANHKTRSTQTTANRNAD